MNYLAEKNQVKVDLCDLCSNFVIRFNISNEYIDLCFYVLFFFEIRFQTFFQFKCIRK